MSQQVLEYAFQYLLHILCFWLQLPFGAKIETDGAVAFRRGTDSTLSICGLVPPSPPLPVSLHGVC